MTTLYVIATPIGNLGDISSRALKILSEVDTILCEDTRVTKKLLLHFGITTRTMNYDAHASGNKHKAILEMLSNGKNLALVSDAGTPCISDPGVMLINEIYKEFGEKIKISPIPGASAATALLSVSGLSSMPFTFLGFIPQKKGRETFFKKLNDYDHTVVIYESPHRFMKTVESLSKNLDADKIVVVGREITKMFEEIKRGNILEISRYFKENPSKVKGEFTIIVGK
jgi:16S rRNA (cytidine1402-2'-O)-methyltransferase